MTRGVGGALTRSDSNHGRGRALALVGLALAVAATAWILRISEGRRAIAACDAALARGDRIEAIVFARAAAEARCPSCSAPELGYGRLATIAKDAEGRADDATAVAAWRATRTALLSTAVIEPSAAARTRADAEIARLEHRIAAAAAAAGAVAAPAASEERLRAALATSSVPSGTVFGLLALGGMLFLGGAVRFARAATLRLPELAVALAGAALAAVGVLLS